MSFSSIGPVALLVICAFLFGIENNIIQRKMATVSPLVSQPIYAICCLSVCAIFFPFRQKLGLGAIEWPHTQLPWIVLTGSIFASGAILFFESFVRGGNAQLAMTMLSILPVITAIINSIIDRKLPSLHVVGATALAVGAILLLRRDPAIIAASAMPPPG